MNVVHLCLRRSHTLLDFDKDFANLYRQKGSTRIALVVEDKLESSLPSDSFTSDNYDGYKKERTKYQARGTDDDEGDESDRQDTGPSPELIFALMKQSHGPLGSSKKKARNVLLNHLFLKEAECIRAASFDGRLAVVEQVEVI